MRVRAPGRAAAAPACSGAQTWPLFPTWAQKGRVKCEGNVLGSTQSSSCPWPEALPTRPPLLAQPSALASCTQWGGRCTGARVSGTACLGSCERAPGLLCQLPPRRGRCSPRLILSFSLKPDPAPCPSQSCMRTHSVLSALPPPSSLVIAVRVKEEHVDMSTPEKASSPELPVSIENIKQETD